MITKYNLERFLKAQNERLCGVTIYNIAYQEMKNGMKRSHWIWYIFPQQKGLGYSYNSEFYGLDGQNEARAYLAHPVLGTRLRNISKVLLNHKGTRNIRQIMGSGIDAKKLQTCMRLFDSISPNDIFAEVLSVYFTKA